MKKTERDEEVVGIAYNRGRPKEKGDLEENGLWGRGCFKRQKRKNGKEEKQFRTYH